ncbi:MAG TPA: putative zinc-binding protein [Thermoleophilia bacterium]|nr:putative zinc-binding protein [Thermoleophilia bacterium]
MAVRRICMHACGGITKVGATVARLATYVVAEELVPEKTLISCAPAFLRGVEEDVLMVVKSPSIALDGCEWSCGTNLLFLAGIAPAVRFLLPEYAEAQGYDLSGGSRRYPSGVTKDFSRRVAERVAGIAAGMMESGSPYRFERPELKKQPEKWFRSAPNMEGVMEFVRIEPGVYRPATMPPLPEESAGTAGDPAPAVQGSARVAGEVGDGGAGEEVTDGG